MRNLETAKCNEDLSRIGSPLNSHLQESISPGRNSSSFFLDSVQPWYVLGILTLSYALAYIDRQLLNLLVDSIKLSLHVSDTQLSLIQGAAFISAYLLAAPLFGRLVDTRNRRNILLFGICAWSLFTGLCGMANTYEELFLARFCVGVSEACVLPVGWSLIADYFSAKRAPRAYSIFMLGPLLGGGFSLLAGGLVIVFSSNVRAQFPLLDTLATWQLAFVLVCLPGFLLALVLLMTVREPTRTVMLKATVDDRQFSIREAASFLWLRRGFYARIYFGVGMLGIVLLGMPAWLPSFMIRFHGVPATLVGFRLGVLIVTFGAAGVLSGPWVVRLLERMGYKESPIRAAAWSMTGLFVFCAAIPFAPGSISALVAIAGAVFFFSLPTGVLAAAMQIGTPSRLRGVVASLYTIMAQLIGYGIGPTAIALFTDKFFKDPKLVGFSIGIICCTASAIGAWLLFSSIPHYRRLINEEISKADLSKL